MPVPPLRLAASPDALRPAFDAIRAELEIAVDFPPEVQAEADAIAASGPHTVADVDLRDIPFVSIDPPGARDLDQAVSIQHADDGFVVHYAIADLGGFIPPGGAVDHEARARGVTVYLPDQRAPLHPPVLSEGVISLLPLEDRQALVWRFVLDRQGRVTATSLTRAHVRNRRAYSYEEAQRAIDNRTAESTIELLSVVGPLRQRLEVARGGVALDVPEQIIEPSDGAYRLELRAPLPVEHWNAQISLMTGMAAADVMLAAGVGVLRTLPTAADEDVSLLRRHARALEVDWPASVGYADFIRSLDAHVPDHAALLAQAGRLFRGAGYVSFDVDRGQPAPAEPAHAAVAAPYSHVTAPLRRLVDRFGNEIVLALMNRSSPPDWLREALPDLPERMADARRKEGAADGRAADVVEAAVLSGCVGAVLDGVVVRRHRRGVQVQVRTPAIVANVDTANVDIASVDLGDEVKVRVDAADVVKRTVQLSIVS